jgi:hypothetical protein
VTVQHEHEFEASPGLPEKLPANEHILWQGAPDWWQLAVHALHVRSLAFYFAGMMAIQAAFLQADGQPLVPSLALSAGLACLALGLLAATAWFSASTTLYTLTNRRIVMRIGIVLTLTFNSLSKSYRSCGYRAGWMIVSGDKKNAGDYIEGLNMLSNMKLCSNVPGQWAIQTALGGYQSINDLVCEGGRLRRQRDLAYELITAIPGLSCVKPQAALYMFPRLDPVVYPIEDDRQFFLELLRETRVMLVQGTGFNWSAPDHFRIVFLPHEDDLREAIGRIAKFLETYRLRHSQ